MCVCVCEREGECSTASLLEEESAAGTAPSRLMSGSESLRTREGAMLGERCRSVNSSLNLKT